MGPRRRWCPPPPRTRGAALPPANRARYSVGAAPRARRHQPHVFLRWMAGEERSEGVHAHVAALAQSVEHPRERDGAFPVMVPERLAVGGDRDNFGTIACGKPLDPRGGIAHQRSEGDVVRERTIIEEQGDATAAGGAMPAGAPARRHTLDLVRRQN